MTDTLTRLISSGSFRISKLEVTGIDNTKLPVVPSDKMLSEEICLMHTDVSNGDEYLDKLHRLLVDGVTNRQAAPVVRFADGEYAFYRKNLHCNGLYRQAESVKAIESALDMHVDALKRLGAGGIIAPWVFHGNTEKKTKGWRRILHPGSIDDSARQFLNFLSDYGITLSSRNYMPFFVVYAYLTSSRFRRFVDGKKIAIIGSEYRPASCAAWFARCSSRPQIEFVEIPASYVATQWPQLKEEVLAKLPADVDLCLVGAGVGALLVCVDAAFDRSIPAIDAGHVLNMMNDREDKSKGPRLFTYYANCS